MLCRSKIIWQRAGWNTIQRYATADHKVLGIRREDKSVWERRAPLCPWHVKELVQQQGVSVIVQPSTRRVFHDREYIDAGAVIEEDLSKASVILGIKEVPPHLLIPERTYLFFSHTRKAQPHNMPLLDEILKKRIRLIDYELMKDPDTQQRLVQFGLFAGYAGMIDFLHVLGRRLLYLGHSTPFLHIAPTYCYPNLETARQAIRSVGQHIRRFGLPEALSPVTFVFTGHGKVATGAQDIFSELPIAHVHPHALADLAHASQRDTRTLYAAVCEPEHYILPKTDATQQKRSVVALRHHYYAHPEEYTTEFHTRIAPFATAIIHGIYWEPKYPRLLDIPQTRALLARPDNKLLGVADISCDLEGSLAFTRQATTIEHPFFVYQPNTDRIVSHDMQAPGLVVMSTDILPTELARDASAHFGDCLMPLIGEIAAAPIHLAPTEAFASVALQRATLAWQGELMPDYQYIYNLRQKNEINLRKETLSKKENTDTLQNTIKLSENRRHRVLILGAGYVVQPVLETLLENPAMTLTVASFPEIPANFRQRYQSPTSGEKGGMHQKGSHSSKRMRGETEFCTLDVAREEEKLQTLVQQHDVIVSLVPAKYHVMVAKACLMHAKHLVTASYISPEMAALNNEAKKRNITMLNEIGLDPGIDHLAAMRLIDQEHEMGNKIKSFVSWCGGLPAPEASNNPFGYKFSWSPKGALLAALKDAQYLMNHKVERVSGEQLLRSAKAVPLFRGFHLEGIPNRDALIYRDLYALREAHTVFRGTLRYAGFCELLDGFKQLGFLDDHTHDSHRVRQSLIQSLSSRASIARHTGWLEHSPAVTSLMAAASWLFDGNEWIQREENDGTVLDAFAKILEKKMAYEEHERDLVLLHHELVSESPTGQCYRLTSSLVTYGDDRSLATPNSYSAMAKTVGYPVAAAVELLLNSSPSSPIERGVIAPMSKSIYLPLLKRLDALGIRLMEKRELIS